ncbi:MAG: DUF1569 domain-containing protein [Bacteroidia bacterium]|nr:DUF1569 domain-containing protein [Bacteroidia bacterium]
MKNFFNPDDRESLIKRIEALSPEAKPLWGKMNVNQMLCHLYDSAKVAMGEVRPKHIGNFITRMKWFKKYILRKDTFPKAKVETAKEVNPMKDGTKPAGFEEDKKKLLEIMKVYSEKADSVPSPEHPILGVFSKEDWGRQMYIHTDHHLKQFGA